MRNETVIRQPGVWVAAPSSISEQKRSYHLKISANGQVTIPKEMREELDWHPGDVLVFAPRKEGFEIYKQLSLREEMASWRQRLSPKTKDMIQKMAGWTISQYHDYFDGLPENVAEMERQYGLK